ncbi:MAG: redoxin domain-containing protein [Deltaproteobacteria bacterium]|nr:MAG: redoxin domain-containing protein [Deltaproteobacteria bacterium]
MVLRHVVLGFLLLCCGSFSVWADVDEPKGSDVSNSSSTNVLVAAPTRVPPKPAPAKVQGVVAGSNGKVLVGAEVSLTRHGWPEELYKGTTQKDGRFALQTRDRGLFWLNIKKKGWANNKVLLWLKPGATVSVEASLKPGPKATRAKTKPKVASKPASRPTTLAAVSHPSSRPAGFAQSQPRLVKTPWKIQPAWAGQLNPVVQLMKSGRKHWRQALLQHKASGKKTPFVYSYKPTNDLIDKQVKAATIPIVKDAWLMLKSSLHPSGRPVEYQAFESWRMGFIKKLVQSTPPQSVLWSLSSMLSQNTIGMIGPEAKVYKRLVMLTHPSPSIRYAFRSRKLMGMGFRWRAIRRSMLKLKNTAKTQTGKVKEQSLAKVKKLEEKLQRAKRETRDTYDEMATLVAKYPSKRLKRGLKRSKWHTHVVFPVGSTITPFKVALWESSKPTFSHNDLKGHHTLIMFWATWCAPCVAKMPLLHRMYKHYKKTKSFQILAVSYDSNEGVLRRYRNKEWKMPWFNHIAKKGSSSNMGEMFETVILPTLFLVGPDGKVMARGMDLRSHTFRSVMTRLLGPLPAKP